jgi:tetratricopeptide (TPR) repeat protein
MDHLVLAIIRPFNRINFCVVLLVGFFSFLSIDHSYAQKRDANKNEERLSEEVKEKVNTFFFEGIRQKNIDNNDAAIRNFLKVIELSANNDAAHFELGLLYTKQKDFANAVKSFEQAASLKPTNEWYLSNYAKGLENTNNFKTAQSVYEKILSLNSDKIEIYFDLASVKLYQNDFKGAIKTYDELEKKIGINEELIIQKQKIWLKLNKIDKAADEAMKLIQSQPTEVKYKINLAELYLANNKLDKAIVILEEISKSDPKNSFVQLALADYYREKKNDEKSYEYLKLAFANPELNIDQKVRILSPYFSVLDNAKMKTRALELSELIVQAHPTEPKANAIYGDFLYQDKQLEKAKLAYEKTLALDKKVFAVWQNLMFIEVDMNDYKSLLETSNSAIDLFPAQQIVHYLNAIAKSQTKDYEGAITAYKNALMLGLPNKETEAQIYAGLGDAYHSLNKHKESDEAYDKALEIKPNDPYVLNNYAYYLSLRNERLEKALEMSLKSNELVKNNSSFLDTYAWIFFQLKKYQDALVYIEKAIKDGGAKSSTIVEHFGDILFYLNRADEAVQQWKKAVELGETSEKLKKKILDKKYYE